MRMMMVMRMSRRRRLLTSVSMTMSVSLIRLMNRWMASIAEDESLVARQQSNFSFNVVVFVINEVFHFLFPGNEHAVVGMWKPIVGIELVRHSRAWCRGDFVVGSNQPGRRGSSPRRRLLVAVSRRCRRCRQQRPAASHRVSSACSFGRQSVMFRRDGGQSATRTGRRQQQSPDDGSGWSARSICRRFAGQTGR
jgi:hypothetical protein